MSSQAADEGHRVEPIPFDGEAAAAWERLRSVVRDMPRTEIIQDDGEWMHATFTSALFRFVDDVLFLMNRENGVIHVRSASRLGYSDLGANRRRVEAIRENFKGSS